MDEIFDVFLLEALVNGILFGVVIAWPEPYLRRRGRGLDLLRRDRDVWHVHDVLAERCL
jgi:hypothetical protein